MKKTSFDRDELIFPNEIPIRCQSIFSSALFKEKSFKSRNGDNQLETDPEKQENISFIPGEKVNHFH